MAELSWPDERARDAGEPRWAQPRSNICLDFHGDPAHAGLAVFSDGNHHMALQECLQTFLIRHAEIGDIFYATTPPGVLLQWLDAGALTVGNLRLAIRPQVFISPPRLLEKIIAAGHATTHEPFMRSRGNVLLVRKANPKNIRGVADLARADVRLFLSNPVTEAPSYQVYIETLNRFARKQGLTLDFLDAGPDAPHPRVLFGERIHHRELPQALADGRADSAPVYYHLALRYTRIFPELFEMVALDGGETEPSPCPEQVISDFHLALIDDGGRWGGMLREFLLGPEAGAIYQHHGLQCHAG
jgi:hypothetical protein